jgi:hypothetical protein
MDRQDDNPGRSRSAAYASTSGDSHDFATRNASQLVNTRLIFAFCPG